MKSYTKKWSLTLLVIITAFCVMMGCLAINSVQSVKADDAPELGASRFSVSTDDESILLVTPLMGDTRNIYEIGYTFSGDQPTTVQADTSHYYTTLVINGVEKHANNLFGGSYTESTPMIIWEIENDAEETYTYSAYYKEGTIATAADVEKDDTLIEGGLYPNLHGDDVPVAGTAKTAKICTVTFKDGDTTLKTQRLAYGQTATDADVAGFTYDWELNSASYDLSTAVTGDITLQGENKTLKTIGMWSGGSIENAKEGTIVDNSGNAISTGSGMSAVSVSTLKYQQANYASDGNVNGIMKWGFDFNAADVSAWIAAGYDWIKFNVYNYSYNNDATPRFETYGVDIISLPHNGWQPVVLSLSEITATTQWQFYINCGAGHHMNQYTYFRAAVSAPEIIDSANRPLPVIFSTFSSLQLDVNSSPDVSAYYRDWEYDKEITALGSKDGGITTETQQVTKTVLAYQKQTPSTDKKHIGRFTLVTGLTSAGIDALKTAGYTKVTYYLYFSCETDAYIDTASSIDGKPYTTSEAARRSDYLILRNRWTKIEVSLDTLKSKIESGAGIAGLIYVYMYCQNKKADVAIGITQPVLEP